MPPLTWTRARPQLVRLMRIVYNSADRHANGRALLTAFSRAERRLFVDGYRLPEHMMRRLIRRYLIIRSSEDADRLLLRDLPARAIYPQPLPPQGLGPNLAMLYPTVGYHPLHPVYYSTQTPRVQYRMRSYWGRDPWFRRRQWTLPPS